MRTSSDGGRTWPEDTEITVHAPEIGAQMDSKGNMEDAWAEMEKFSVGLPATAVLPGGDVVVVYYSGPRADVTDIRWAGVRTD